MNQYKQEFKKDMKWFLHQIDEHASEYTNEDFFTNVRVPMVWPDHFDAQLVTLSITRALTKQVYDLRSNGIHHPIWIDFDAEKLVVAFDDVDDAVLFKLTYDGAA